jgi:hypothetical protein
MNLPIGAKNIQERYNHLEHDLASVLIEHWKRNNMQVNNVIEGWHEDSKAHIEIQCALMSCRIQRN